jgi:hypothetical protein
VWSMVISGFVKEKTIKVKRQYNIHAYKCFSQKGDLNVIKKCIGKVFHLKLKPIVWLSIYQYFGFVKFAKFRDIDIFSLNRAGCTFN